MDLKELDSKLIDWPYVTGWAPTQDDVKVLSSLPSPQAGDAKYDNLKHLKRWIKHMASFSEGEKKCFPAGKAPAVCQKSSKPSAADDDDDIDLFGSDVDEEDEKMRAERAQQLEAKKKEKPAVIAKSSIVLDVKVWDDETDLKEVEAQVRKIEKDGLLWGAAKTVPLAFGVSKLQIVCVVEDAKISVDWLTEQIEENELVQSTDIAAFQKI